jgi:hypothetical protein
MSALLTGIEGKADTKTVIQSAGTLLTRMQRDVA